MSRTENNYDSSVFYLRGIRDELASGASVRQKTLFAELEELIKQYGTKQYFVEFIKTIHDSTNPLSNFADVDALKKELFLLQKIERDSRRGGKKSHKKSHRKKSGKKSHRKKSGKKSHRKSRRH
jgi:hypothetical protein